MKSIRRIVLSLCVLASLAPCLLPEPAGADSSKAKSLSQPQKAQAVAPLLFGSPGEVGGTGYRTAIHRGDISIPVVVVSGTPYQMGWHLGRLMRPEIHTFIPKALDRLQSEIGLSGKQLDRVWATTAAFTDDRFEQELLGLAAGSGLPVRMLQHVHCLPLLLPYSCSSIAAWGRATADGHLYQTRDLDWDLSVKAHEYPVIVVYFPTKGHAQVLPTFAGVIGANCGMNDAGIVLSEMGDSPQREMPYNLMAPHFTTFFRTILYDAGSLPQALAIFEGIPHTKRYHFVFGEGKHQKGAVKILVHGKGYPPNDIRIWKDNDPQDELAPAVLPDLVYQDEGRGAFPTLKKDYGHLNAKILGKLADHLAIHGDNVLDVVFDGTALRLWVSYAHGDKEAYQRPYLFFNLNALEKERTQKSGLAEN